MLSSSYNQKTNIFFYSHKRSLLRINLAKYHTRETIDENILYKYQLLILPACSNSPAASRKVTDELQTDIIKIFMDSLATGILKLAAKRKAFIVVDTRGTLRDERHWIDEIHPDTVGFKKIANVMYSAMAKIFPQLKSEK